MNKIVRLSIARKSVPVCIDVVQYATAPSITFIIDDYIPNSEASARIYIKKPSGHIVFNSCSLSDNRITYDPTRQSFAEKGLSVCQLQIVNGNKVADSFLIYAYVEENIMDTTSIESTDEYGVLEDLIVEAEQYNQAIRNAQQTADEANELANSLSNQLTSYVSAKRYGTLDDGSNLNSVEPGIYNLRSDYTYMNYPPTADTSIGGVLINTSTSVAGRIIQEYFTASKWYWRMYNGENWLEWNDYVSDIQNAQTTADSANTLANTLLTDRALYISAKSQSTLANNSNLDNVEPGIHNLSNSNTYTNAPVNGTGGILIYSVSRNATGYRKVQQFFTQNKWYFRYYTGETWGTWKDFTNDITTITTRLTAAENNIDSLISAKSRGVLSAGSNLNNANPGIYSLSSNANYTNSPLAASTGGVLLTSRTGENGRKVQMVFNQSHLYFRVYTGETWGTWVDYTDDISDLSESIATNTTNIGLLESAKSKGDLPIRSDLNTVGAGIYSMIANYVYTNSPMSEGTGGVLISTTTGNNGRKIQLAFNASHLYFRIYTGASWQPWQDYESDISDILTRLNRIETNKGDITGKKVDASDIISLKSTRVRIINYDASAFMQTEDSVTADNVILALNNIDEEYTNNGLIIANIMGGSAGSDTPTSRCSLFIHKVGNAGMALCISFYSGWSEQIGQRPGFNWFRKSNSQWSIYYGNNVINDPTLSAPQKSVTFVPINSQDNSTYGGCYYNKTGRRVHVHIGVQGLTANTLTEITTLPEGFRPGRKLYGSGFNGTSGTVTGYIQTDGIVKICSTKTTAAIDFEYNAWNQS